MVPSVMRMPGDKSMPKKRTDKYYYRWAPSKLVGNNEGSKPGRFALVGWVVGTGSGFGMGVGRGE